MGKNDFTATACITLEQWQKDISKMEANITMMESRAAKLEKALNKVGGALKIGAAGAAVASFTNTMADGGKEAGRMSKALADLDESGYDYAQGFANDGNRIQRTLLDISGALSGIPIIGAAFDFLTAPITATARFGKDMRVANIETQRVAGSAGELQEKMHKLTELQADFRTKSTFGVYKGEEKREQVLAQLTQARVDAAREYLGQIGKEAGASNAIITGSEKQSKLLASDLELQKEIAHLVEGAKNKKGQIDATGQKMIKAGSQAARDKAAAREKEIIAVDAIAKIEGDAAIEVQRQRMDGLNGAEEAARITVAAAIKEHAIADTLTVEVRRAAAIKVEAAEAELELAIRARRLGDIGVAQAQAVNAANNERFTAMAAADRAALDAATKKKNLFRPGSVAFNAAEAEEESARDKLSATLEQLKANARIIAQETGLMEFRLSNTKLVSDLEATRVKYAEQIRAALFSGNQLLAEQLNKQQALTALQIRAANILMTPKEKADAAREEKRQQGAIRAANQQDANESAANARDMEYFRKWGVMPQNRGFIRSGTAKSKATDLAVQQMAARHKLPAGQAAQPKIVVQAMQVVDFVATVIRSG